MIFYKKYLGDYAAGTGHLSLMQHGAYNLLLDHYYSTRSPLPADLDALYRLCRAMTKPEQEAVKAVADQYFRPAADGLRHNRRADLELAKWEEMAQINRERGRRGGRPKKNPGGNPPANPDGNPPGSDPETRALTRTDSREKPAAKAGENPLQKSEVRSQIPEPTPASGVLVEDSSDARPQQRTLAPQLSHQEVIDVYHELLPELPRVKVWSKKRGQALDARIRERCAAGKPADTLTYWRDLFGRVAQSDFLCGRGKTDFRADLEWLVRPENFAKVIEGRYANRRQTNGGPRAGAG